VSACVAAAFFFFGATFFMAVFLALAAGDFPLALLGLLLFPLAVLMRLCEEEDHEGAWPQQSRTPAHCTQQTKPRTWTSLAEEGEGGRQHC
jgi:hypothetical protein